MSAPNDKAIEAARRLNIEALMSDDGQPPPAEDPETPELGDAWEPPEALDAFRRAAGEEAPEPPETPKERPVERPELTDEERSDARIAWQYSFNGKPIPSTYRPAALKVAEYAVAKAYAHTKRVEKFPVFIHPDGAREGHDGVIGKNHELSVAQLRAWLGKVTSTPRDKETGPFLSPGHTTVTDASGQRKEKNCKDISVLLLDADDVGDWHPVMAVLMRHGGAWFRNRSSNHCPNGCEKHPKGAIKWHLIIPLRTFWNAPNNTNVARAEWKEQLYPAARFALHLLGELTGKGFDLPLAQMLARFYPGAPTPTHAGVDRELKACNGLGFDIKACWLALVELGVVDAKAEAERIERAAAPRKQGSTNWTLNGEPPMVQAFTAAGLYLGPQGDGHNVICPWADKHSDGRPHAWVSASGATFKCHHTHTEGRHEDQGGGGWREVLAALPIEAQEVHRKAMRAIPRDPTRVTSTPTRVSPPVPPVAPVPTTEQGPDAAPATGKESIEETLKREAEEQAEVTALLDSLIKQIRCPQDTTRVYGETGVRMLIERPEFIEEARKLTGANRIALCDEVSRQGASGTQLIFALKEADQEAEANGEAPKGARWQSQLERSKNDGVRNSMFNTELVLLNDERWKRLRFNCLTLAVEIERAVVAEETVTGIRLDIKKLYGFEPTKENTWDVLLHIAMRNSYHPVERYLDSLKWDGTKRIDQILKKVFKLKNPTRLQKAMMMRWLIAAVARVRHLRMRDTAKVDSMLTLVGEQGWLKSTFFVWLVSADESWLSDSYVDIKNKDGWQVMHRSWLFEIAEADKTISKVQASEMKAFVTQRADVFRPPYARIPREFRRGFVIGATTNKLNFLNDPTGARRFWPIVLEGRLDLKALDPHQIWAEADHLFKHGEQYHLTPEETLLHDELVERFREGDTWEGIIRYWINKFWLNEYDVEIQVDGKNETVTRPPLREEKHWLTTKIIVDMALDLSARDQRECTAKRLNDVMRALGYVNTRPRVKAEDQGLFEAMFRETWTKNSKVQCWVPTEDARAASIAEAEEDASLAPATDPGEAVDLASN